MATLRRRSLLTKDSLWWWSIWVPRELWFRRIRTRTQESPRSPQGNIFQPVISVCKPTVISVRNRSRIIPQHWVSSLTDSHGSARWRYGQASHNCDWVCYACDTALHSIGNFHSWTEAECVRWVAGRDIIDAVDLETFAKIKFRGTDFIKIAVKELEEVFAPGPALRLFRAVRELIESMWKMLKYLFFSLKLLNWCRAPTYRRWARDRGYTFTTHFFPFAFVTSVYKNPVFCV